MKKDRNKIFFLGGIDLEMSTIKLILESEGYHYFDHNLSWDNALVSSYENELNKFGRDPYILYGIELQKDINTLPSNYETIDHHGDKATLPSALEQVAQIIGYELNLDQQLIAANDRGSKNAMRDFLSSSQDTKGITPEEIEVKIQEIRKMDRVAQGVTEEDEKTAEREIQEGIYHKEENLRIVKTKLKKFSPIVDRLEDHCTKVIFNDTELTVFGLGAQIIGSSIADKFKIPNDKYYTGGGEHGYWGITDGYLTYSEILDIANYIKDHKMDYSGHIFYFPFSWKIKGTDKKTLEDKINLEKIEHRKDSVWKAISSQKRKQEDKEEMYNEKNYFYSYVHSAIYENDEKPVSENSIRHFEIDCGGDARYEILSGGKIAKKFSLRIDSINLNIYSNGVGLLSFYLKNDTNICHIDGKPNIMNEDDILMINQYGRRINPPFFADKEKRDETSRELSIVNLPGFGVLREDFNTIKENDSWKPASFIKTLIENLSSNIDFKPVIDDRMYVMSWYKNSSLVKDICKDTDTWNQKSNNDFWYRYMYVDMGWATCQNQEMRQKLLNQSTYKRWEELHSLYGITRYSMVFLTKDDVPNHLIQTFSSIYARMAELVLMQRASLLYFADEASNIGQKLKQHKSYKYIRSLYNEYICFLNNLYHRDVTAQDQGIEIYAMMHKALKMDEAIKDLDEDINELYQYVSMDESTQLNVIMGIFAPASLIAGIWGMNSLCDLWNWGSLIEVSVIILLTSIISLIFFNRIKKK